MTDRYPNTFAIDIDSRGLCRYMRLQRLSGMMIGFVFFGLMFGLISALETLETDDFITRTTFIMRLAIGTCSGGLIGAAIALLIYLCFFHISAARQASSLQVSVEGPYLRLIQGHKLRSDRKLHFRSLVDYTVTDSPLMQRCGVQTLEITTIGYGPMLRITGIKDCTKVRDMLAEIDSIREIGA